MENTKKSPVILIAQTAMMIAITLILQYFIGSISGGNQLLVGSVVNFCLFMSVFLCGLWGGAFVGILTPLLALFIGILANPLLVPFVAASNFLMLLTFWLALKIKQKNDAVRMVIAFLLACLVKYAAMTLSANFVLPLFLMNEKQLAVIAQMWGVLQLITALIGAAVAFFVAPRFKRFMFVDERLKRD